jgi:hypothetical protein
MLRRKPHFSEERSDTTRDGAGKAGVQCQRMGQEGVLSAGPRGVEGRRVLEACAGADARDEQAGLAQPACFDTALATCVDQDAAVSKVEDVSGLATGAKVPGMEHFASAHLDARWGQGIARLPIGATVASVNFAPVVMAGLAGCGPVPPRPEMVAMIFGQLFAAGSSAQGALPFGGSQTKKAPSAGRAAIQLDDAMRAEMMKRQEQVVASGTPRDALESVLSCISNATGASFLEKLACHRKSASKSLSSQQSVQTLAPATDGTGFTVETSDGKATYHVTVQVQCTFACNETRGYADYLATETIDVRKCFRAVTARKFSSADWSFALLVPDLAMLTAAHPQNSLVVTFPPSCCPFLAGEEVFRVTPAETSHLRWFHIGGQKTPCVIWRAEGVARRRRRKSGAGGAVERPPART